MGYRVVYSSELSHHGILGQKWGVRRFQNPDGTLTEKGKQRLGKEIGKEAIATYRAAPWRNTNMEQFIVCYNMNSFTRKKLTNQSKEYSEVSKLEDEYRKKVKSASSEISDEVNKQMTKKYGKFLDLDESKQASYISDGIMLTKKLVKDKKYTSQYAKEKKEFIDARKKYEKEISDFLDSYMGKYGQKEITKIKDAIKVDLKTGEVKKQTLKDITLTAILYGTVLMND